MDTGFNSYNAEMSGSNFPPSRFDFNLMKAELEEERTKNSFGHVDHAEGDEEYRIDDAAADAWLTQNRDGTRLLYPRLFIVEPVEGATIKTPPRNSSQSCLFDRLPSEIRSLIYLHYWDDEEDDGLDGDGVKDDMPVFPTTDEAHLTRLNLTSEDKDLKFWLSRPLLRASRQLRFEVLPVLLGSKVFTTEWLTVLPRFVDFLGPEGCAMIRYLDLWDWHCLAFGEKYVLDPVYASILRSIHYLPRLRHLRLVMPYRQGMNGSGVHELDWDVSVRREDSKHPKMVIDDLRSRIETPDAWLAKAKETLRTPWLEYELLAGVATKDFTLATEGFLGGYVEFDRTSETFLALLSSMRANCYERRSIIPQAVEIEGCMENYTSAVAQQSALKHYGSTPSIPAGVLWQETDTLPSKTIPLYNFVLDLAADTGLQYLRPHCSFPRAVKSTGAIMRDCGMCYCAGQHCGYHAMPTLYEHEADVAEFENLTYHRLRRTVATYLEAAAERSEPARPFFRALTVQQYLGWPTSTGHERLVHLYASTGSAWEQQKASHLMITAWDALYKRLKTHYAK